MTELTPEQKQQAKERVFVTAMAGVFPSQHDNQGPCVILCPADRDNEKLVMELLPELPPPGVQTWPHRKTFHLRPDVMIGTVDELVAEFRRKLELAATAMVSQNIEGLPYKDVRKSVENAVKLGYTPGKAFSMPTVKWGDPLTREWLKFAAFCR